MPEWAVTVGGAPSVSSGSQIAWRGIRCGLATPIFISVFGSVMTETGVASEPVPAVVGSAISGTTGPGHRLHGVVVLERAAVREQQRGDLRQVDHAAAADGDDHVGLRRAAERDRGVDRRARHVDRGVGEHARPRARPQRGSRTVREARRGGDHRVGA